MPKNRPITILVDKRLLDKIDEVRLREPRSSFLYRLIHDALKPRKKRLSDVKEDGCANQGRA